MIEAGQELLHYRLVEKIGEGGMGVVWRATDTSLARDVAIKILPDAFARNPDRLARFEREAKLLASLNGARCCGRCAERRLGVRLCAVRSPDRSQGVRRRHRVGHAGLDPGARGGLGCAASADSAERARTAATLSGTTPMG